MKIQRKQFRKLRDPKSLNSAALKCKTPYAALQTCEDGGSVEKKKLG
jgi:hypothetical protein